MSMRKPSFSRRASGYISFGLKTCGTVWKYLSVTLTFERTHARRKSPNKPEAYSQKCKPPPGDAGAEHDFVLYISKRGFYDSKRHLKELSEGTKSNIFGTNSGLSAAHLIPKYLSCSCFYGPLGRLLTGIDANTALERFYIVHGWKNDVKHRGIKNLPLNLLGLPLAKFFSRKLCQSPHHCPDHCVQPAQRCIRLEIWSRLRGGGGCQGRSNVSLDIWQ